ncbi:MULTISPECIES: M23 family metallopeptidase [unclassified Thermosynechococcus]|uniref:M23 family metallopeptidase n=1 Tax=unclassified Thermosynechococcus TaxID=2622553 RepID=UPI0019E54454|nr:MULTISPECIES: M23 family metallopeptidase [unclassified Thermosynechococcus]HIK35723.1 M23 family metallopeptidase [Thermosynechococcus sp. M98_K2018_005]HIK47837.1 M23 family metallopeptidase [Thermosynechococcus sp. M55_K2018_012]
MIERRVIALGLTMGLLTPTQSVAETMPVEPEAAAPILVNPVQPLDSEPLVFSTKPVDPPPGSEPLENLKPARSIPVVIQERSTGCQAIVSEGIPPNICQAQGAQQPPVTPIATSASHRPVVAANPRNFVPSAQTAAPAYVRQPFPGPNPLRWLKVNNGQMLFPLPFPVPITSTFGWRIHPIFGDRRFHSGTDLGAPQGTPVLAVFDGRVVESNWLGGYGLTVILQHPPEQHQTLYAHLSQLFVNPGQWVKQGDVIGLVGSTGNSTGPHLHFEIHEMTAQGLIPVAPEARLELALVQLKQAIAQARQQSHRSS